MGLSPDVPVSCAEAAGQKPRLGPGQKMGMSLACWRSRRKASAAAAPGPRVPGRIGMGGTEVPGGTTQVPGAW